ncbi:MAG TPA: thiamine pyrophosphate-binding protein [Candidatus Sulfotelmatobacter sp.]|nr:thiamine pyrophosphate-binding protein [Candidatus Sulfotelmatobacter sp.]
MSQNTESPRTGGRVLVDALLGHGVDLVFGVPGESYLATLDAFYDVRNRVRLLTCRHEAGACNMAEAYGKLTGRPGICFVTRGPGACHASIGLHTALQDSTPLILFIGQVDRDAQEREGFQEIDYRRMFGPLAKWVAQIDNAARIPEMVSHAFHTAVAGRPGPVVLALPEDMQRDLVAVADVGPYKVVRPHPGPADMERLCELLAGAARPLLILGGGAWSDQAVADIRHFAESFDLPVAVSFRCQDRFDNRHANYIGDLGTGSSPKLVQRVKDSDLLIVAGPRLGEQTTQGYSLIGLPRPKQTLVHVHASAEELGRVFVADLPINAGPAEFAAAARRLVPLKPPAWSALTKAARADYVENLQPGSSPGALDMNAVMGELARRLPQDAIMVTDAGNFSGWVQRYWQHSSFHTLVAPTSGAMGYGVAAAVGAAAPAPDRQVVCFVGDGGFLMSAQELATARQYGLKPLIVLVNNGLYGTIRMHQERDFPGRSIANALENPDFAAYARAFGCCGETVSRTADFAPALDRALKSGKAAVIELQQDAEAITTRATLSQIGAAARARQKH